MHENILIIIFSIFIFSPVLIYKSPFLKVSIVIFAYPLLILFGYYIGIEPTRVVANVGDAFYASYYLEGLLYSISAYAVFLISLYSVKDVNYEAVKLPFTMPIRCLIFVMLICILPIAYPHSFFMGGARFGSFGTVVVFLISLLILSSSIKYDFLVFGVLSIVLFAILRGERVDFILVILSVYFVKSKKDIPLFKLLLFFVFLLVLGVYSVMKRSGEEFQFMTFITVVINNVTSFGTAVDVVHIYMSSIWYVKEVGYTSAPLLNYLFSFIPFPTDLSGAGSSYNFVALLREHIPNLGGGLFYIPFVMFTGVFGVCIGSYVYGKILAFFIKQKGYSNVFFLCLFIMQFRLQWYGLTYFGNLFILILLLLVLLYLLKKSGVINNKKN